MHVDLINFVSNADELITGHFESYWTERYKNGILTSIKIWF
jgi:hypothetical protein